MKSQTGEDGWWQFIELSRQLKTKEQFNEFFDLFLTIDERDDIKDRVVIARELLQGKKAQREIAAEHHISIAKISRGSNYLKIISENLRKFLEDQLL